MRRIKKFFSKIYYGFKLGRKRNVTIHHGAYIGRDSYFEGNNVIHEDTYFKGTIGFASCIGDNCLIDAMIGRYCSIGSYVYVTQYKHPTRNFVSTHPCFYSIRAQAGFSFVEKQKFEEYAYAVCKDGKKYAVRIGNDVWIGSHVNILAGVSIGDGAIIASGAVVTKDIEPYSIVGGVPASLIRKRFTDEEIELLLETKWWEKDFDWLKKNANSFNCIANYEKLFKEGKE